MELLSAIRNVLPSQAACDAPKFDYSVKRADPHLLRTVFLKFASVEHEGERFMAPLDFTRDLLQMDGASFNEATTQLFSGVVDQTKDRLISFPEFQAFEALLCKPDAKHRLLFQLFDLDGKGSITFGEFKFVIEKTVTFQKVKFDMNGEFVNQYFGKKRTSRIYYSEFTEFIKAFNAEYLRQAFHKLPSIDGTITALHFAELVSRMIPHKLSSYVAENAVAAASINDGRRVSYIFLVSFVNLLDNLTVIDQMIKRITGNSTYAEVSREQILLEANKHPQITPMQIEILFQLCSLSHPDKGKITLHDLHLLVPQHNPLTAFSKIAEFKRFDDSQAEMDPPNQAISMQLLESAYRFLLGSIAGGTGAAFVYPIDLVKTRMQNQRSVLAGEILYKNSFDCFFKVLRNEGVVGLYRGLIPQLIGVSPEKAIKLTTNDFIRGKMRNKDGEITVMGEVLAGGCGGMAQVMFTNPIEIVKIRMQVAGEAGTIRPSAWVVAKELGPFGLYKGARACFLRDIPFSAIYFPTYAHLKLQSADKNGHNSWWSLLLSAAGAGVPAAYLVTPADVIKTRLQVKARRGQQTYRGVTDCVRKIWAEEGGSAFWKGGPARIFRSSPQFGVTLLTYELLQRWLYVDFGSGKPMKTEVTPSNPEVSMHPDHIGGLRLALATFSGVETRFGLFLPKFKPRPT